MARPIGPLSGQRLAWSRQRAQARYRGEPWELDFDVWWEMWEPLWHLRGMATDDYCMIRRDDNLPWQESNVLLVQRWQYLSNQGPYYKIAHKS